MPVRRSRLILLLRAPAVAALAIAAASLRPASAPAAFERPSVVVIMTDDQTYADMAAMPKTRRLIGGAGARFTRSYVSLPLCCPSRATFLTGQYAHNNGVHTNTPPQGGVEALDAQHTLPVWLSAAGYRTSHIGKYLNGYGLRRRPDVPPGWTDWHGAVDKSTYQMYGYKLFENGTLQQYGNFDVEDPALYQTDVLRDKAVGAIEGTAPSTPLFLSLAFVAPHGEVMDPGSTTQPFVRAAPRHVGHFRNLRAPRAFRGERDVRDKPPYVRKLHLADASTAARIRADFRSRRESLLAVDDAVEAVVGALARTGRLDSTYLLFTSDNGFFQGEHRIVKGKYLAYDPSTRVPLLIRGPGIAPGTVSGELVSNVDLAPTLLDATGAPADRPLDGRSLLPFARDARLRTTRPVLHEGLEAGDIDRDGAQRSGTVGEYHAIRTARYLYIEWLNGAVELYDRARDPGEMHSRHRDRRYRRIRRALHRDLVRLRTCRGAACNAPIGPLRR
jgi:N-acetylglucosamine-6-sulfatase